MNAEFDTVEDALKAIAAGEMIVVADDDDRENEGDLIMAASKATPEAVAFMIRHTSGILCAPLLEEQAGSLHLDPMVARNDAPMSTAFTVSIDYKKGLTTGISAEERAATVQALTNSNVAAEDFVRRTAVRLDEILMNFLTPFFKNLEKSRIAFRTVGTI